MTPWIYIAIGANLPGPLGASPLANCQGALELFSKHDIRITGISKTYESEPYPPSDQPWFINAVARVETRLSPRELLEELLLIEAARGRTRLAKNAPRTIDLDLIDYGGRVIPGEKAWLRAETQDLAGGFFLPHLRAHRRNFVLKPLLDIAPSWAHPVLKTPGRALLQSLDQPGKICRAGGALTIP